MAQVTPMGIDIAKNVVFVHGVDTHGHVVVTKRLARQTPPSILAKFPSSYRQCLTPSKVCG
jgi:hypothetical protein